MSKLSNDAEYQSSVFLYDLFNSAFSKQIKDLKEEVHDFIHKHPEGFRGSVAIPVEEGKKAFVCTADVYNIHFSKNNDQVSIYYPIEGKEITYKNIFDISTIVSFSEWWELENKMTSLAYEVEHLFLWFRTLHNRYFMEEDYYIWFNILPSVCFSSDLKSLLPLAEKCKKRLKERVEQFKVTDDYKNFEREILYNRMLNVLLQE